MNAKVLGIVGWKNSGKTTLIERLVKEMTGRGLRLSTIKHAHHDFDIDTPGKDSYRHREAGAGEVLVASDRRWALIHETRGEAEPSLETLIAKLTPCDLILVEGFKRGAYPKIQVSRSPCPEGLIVDRDGSIIAVATDNKDLVAGHLTLPLNEPRRIAQFIEEHFDLGTRHP